MNRGCRLHGRFFGRGCGCCGIWVGGATGQRHQPAGGHADKKELEYFFHDSSLKITYGKSKTYGYVTAKRAIECRRGVQDVWRPLMQNADGDRFEFFVRWLCLS